MSILTRRSRVDEVQWTLRVSKRCRRARLQIKPFGGLEVVIPPRFPRHQIEGFVFQHRDWIKSKLAEQQRKQQSLKLPDTIDLALDNSCTAVIYNSDSITPRSEAVCIKSNTPELQALELRQWIRQRAWQLLPPLLDDLSEKTGIDYKKVSIRSQKTRWGSCSSNGTISLNDQLLFVDKATVEYLMIHELCHRKVMNHSSRFWQLVAQFCVDFRDQEVQLDRARHSVPTWFLASLYR